MDGFFTQFGVETYVQMFDPCWEVQHCFCCQAAITHHQFPQQSEVVQAPYGGCIDVHLRNAQNTKPTRNVINNLLTDRKKEQFL